MKKSPRRLSAIVIAIMVASQTVLYMDAVPVAGISDLDLKKTADVPALVEMAEAMKPEIITSGGAKSDGVELEDTAADEVESEDTVAGEVESEDTVADEVESEDTVADEVESEDTAADEVESEDTAADEVESEDTGSENGYPLNYQGVDDVEVRSIEAYLLERENELPAYEEEPYIPDELRLVTADMEGTDTVSLERSYTTPYVTSVKDQDSYGTCWAHAAIGAAESNLVKQGLSDDTIDLSEWQLAYFMYHSVTDPLGGTSGDDFTMIADSEAMDYLDRGGNQTFATYHIAGWHGLVRESDAPYQTVCNDRSATLPDSYAYSRDAVHLKNAYWISMEDLNYVKAAIKKYGAAAVSYYSTNSAYNQSNHYNCTSPLAVYNPNRTSTNHGVLLVGWDDDFDRNQFGTYKPSGNGAWLCKNSWGASFGQNGYFWISYEDSSLLSGNAYFYEMSSADDYDYNYQYDGAYTSGRFESYTYEANVYTASSDQTLQAVGFYTSDISYEYTVSIYKDCRSGSPIGTLMSCQSGEQLYAGYHTVALEVPVNLNAGDSFSIVIRQETAEGTTPVICVDMSNEGSWYKGVSSAQTGQSYMGDGSSWWDINRWGGSYNCRIKAYTDEGHTGSSESMEIPINSIGLSSSVMTLKKGAAAVLTATISPENATNPQVEWKSGNTAVASVSGNGNRVTITAKAKGTAKITCVSKDGNHITASCMVTVTQPVEQITLSPNSLTLQTGHTVNLLATILPASANNKSVTWSSSDTSVASVSGSGSSVMVTARSKGSTTITCRSQDGSAITSVCKVTVTQPVQSIYINKSKIELQSGETEQLLTTILPANANDQRVLWKSSDSGIVAVNSSGLVRGVGAGTATVYCIAQDGSYASAACTITVKNYTKTQQFVSRLYNKCLGRKEEAAGLEHWNTLLVNRQRSGAEVAYGFVFSAEYKAKHTSDSEYVDMLYQVFMDRSADDSGKQHWMELLSRGVSREYVFRGFAQSQEFTNICNSYNIERGMVVLSQARDQNPKLTAYVNRMYTQALGRAGEEDGLNHWCREIQSNNRTPEQVAEAFINSDEFKHHHYNDEQYVKILYRTFMGREADSAGLTHWKKELARGCTREEILHRFAMSKEFRNIQAQFGL